MLHQQVRPSCFLSTWGLADCHKSDPIQGNSHCQVQSTHVFAHLNCSISNAQGAKNARLHEVPMDYQTLTSGDVFILDLYNKLMLWSGRQANVAEKAKAREVLAALQESRKGQPEVNACLPFTVRPLSLRRLVLC